jgi:hypothetical protein
VKLKNLLLIFLLYANGNNCVYRTVRTKDGEERHEVKYINARLLAMFDWFMHKAPFWSKHIYEKKVPINARKTFAQFVLKTHKDALRDGDFVDIWKNHISLTNDAVTTSTADSVISKMMTPRRVSSDVGTGAGAGVAGALLGLARAAGALESSQGGDVGVEKQARSLIGTGAASPAPSTPSRAPGAGRTRGGGTPSPAKIDANPVGNASSSPGRRRGGVGTPSPTKGARAGTMSPAKRGGH